MGAQCCMDRETMTYEEIQSRIGTPLKSTVSPIPIRNKERTMSEVAEEKLNTRIASQET